jgi:fructuronate reductase
VALVTAAVQRLHPTVFAALPPQVARPRYDRGALRSGIVHLGVGAFQRAHLAAATQAALHATGDLHWGITGVSLRHADTRDALAPQQGLYTLALRDGGPDGRPREQLQVIGALTGVLVAPEDPVVVLDAIAHSDTRIVSLTVTEKGYHHDPATGTLRLDDADIRHDLAHSDAPRTTLGFIVRGLQRRQRHDRAPLTLLSCDNLPANGDTLRGLVLAFARQVDPSLHAWIAARCTFPNSMVDRIVPRTTPADRERISAVLGVDDAWPVVAEPFFDWVIEDRFAAGRPEWQHGGTRFVDHAEPFEQLKLRMVNGSHSALAYLGAMAGLRTVDQAVAQPVLRRYIDTLMRDEIAPTLPALPGMDLDTYRARLLQRFANPALAHQTQQIAMDGSQKLPQRLLGTVRDRLRAGLSIDHLALAVAAWVHYLRGCDEGGARYEIQDPLADALARQLATASRASLEPDRVASFCAYAPVFGDLGSDLRFVRAVARHTQSLREHGVLATLEALHA